MNDDFRNRAFLPVVIPLGILVVVVAGIGLYWWLLSFNTREGAFVLAMVAAAGILVAMTLATSQDSLSRGKQFGVALAALGPIAIGAVIAGGAFGLDPATLNINAQPEEPSLLLDAVDPEAPVMAAESLNSFCLPGGGGCEETNEWAVESTADIAEMITYTFDNRDSGVEHNLALFALPEEGSFGASVDALGTDPLSPSLPDTFPGAEERSYEFEWAAGEEGAEPVQPEEFYFVCTVHPSTMWGVGTIEG